jgi:hypothetical protein
MFRRDGGHKAINATDADGVDPQKMDVTEMPDVGDKGKQVWLTRGSTHPRYLSLMGLDGDDAPLARQPRCEAVSRRVRDRPGSFPARLGDFLRNCERARWRWNARGAFGHSPRAALGMEEREG